KFPKSIKGGKGEKIIKFYSSIIDSAPKCSFSALKPNYAYFAQYGLEGIQALHTLIQKYKSKYTIILDVKRGDISSTAKAYAKEGYEFFNAHALTLSPLMGRDSISPYLEYFPNGRGAYLLCRTSNEGANDFLTQPISSPLYSQILTKGIQWHPKMGFVVGATSPQDLSIILAQLPASTKTPLLIPGVGSQGGSAAEVVAILKNCPNLLPLARINASSSISYAYLKSNSPAKYAEAAHEAMAKLNESLQIY
ncbi:MAG: orotidine-5'-phosphate decarboxylase, partial [Candidatus Micrarchaeota archaeon]